MNSRTPLRLASLDTSPPFDGVEEGNELANLGTLPLPPAGGEVSPRSGDGVGEATAENRSRRQNDTTPRARRLRQGDNKAEALLWLELKRRKLGGFKFTRQLPIGPYFADFACREEWLVVEIDGSQHADNPYDRKRDEFMLARGYSVLRFWNTDVLKHRNSVCETILATLNGHLASNQTASDFRFVYSPPAANSLARLSGETL